MSDDPLNTKERIIKAQKTVTIEKRNCQSTIIENKITTKNPNLKQETHQRKIIPSQTNRVPLENQLWW